MKRTIVTCGDGSIVKLDWVDTFENICRFIFEYYGKSVDKVWIRCYN